MELNTHLFSIEKALVDRAKQTRTPVNGSIELLPVCNMNCDMCYVRLNYEEMEALGGMRSVEEWIRVGDEMAQSGVLFLLLTGGEPLFYPEFKKLYLTLRKLGLILTINTNGTLIDEEWAEFFGTYKPRRINITLYGKDNRTYEELCHYKNGFDKVVCGIRLLKNKGVDVKINGSITPQNVSEIDEMIEISKRLEVPITIDTYMMPAKRERVNDYDLEARLDPITAAYARMKVLLGEMGPELFAEYVKKMTFLVEKADLLEKGNCKMACLAGSCSFSVNWQGELHPCVILTEPKESLLEKHFSDAWESMQKKIETIRLSEKCSSCKFRAVCRTCAASALLEGGSYESVPQYMCSYTEEFFRLITQYKKEILDNK